MSALSKVPREEWEKLERALALLRELRAVRDSITSDIVQSMLDSAMTTTSVLPFIEKAMRGRK